MSTEQPSIEELKASLDIVTVAEKYLTLKKYGANYKTNCPVHGEKTPSFVVSPAKQIFHCFGCGIGGSVLDMVMILEPCEIENGIKILKNLNGIDDYQVTRVKQAQYEKEAEEAKFSLYQIGLFANSALSAVSPYMPFTVEVDGSSYVQIKEPFVKLFETDKLPIETNKRLQYVYTKLLGYDNFYTCPSIIIRDAKGKVVDMAAYRPNKPEKYDTWDSKNKYFMKNEGHLRGDDFLYPFQQEMETIMDKKKIFAVGEGLKNGLNAYVHGFAFVSLESASVEASEELIAYVLSLLKKGYQVLAFFDGDGGHDDPAQWTKGKLAFEKFKQSTKLYDLENAVSFDSGIDFAEYAVGAGDA